jgi:hypothetical protein
MRVYAVCRKCAEVHLTESDPRAARAARPAAEPALDPPRRARRRLREAEPSCPSCTRRALLAAPSAADWSPPVAAPIVGEAGSAARVELAVIGASPSRSRRFWFAAAVLGAYLLALLGLLAAVLLGHDAEI